MLIGDLTILIPTYNRRKSLEKTLDALEKQSDQNFEIIISDNCSNYKVSEVLENRDFEFCQRIRIERNEVNVGMDINIGYLFMKCSTAWAWLLGDDDFVCEDAIKKIKTKIKEHDDCSWIDFPVYDFEKIYNKDIVINSIDELISVLMNLKEQKISTSNGNIIFISNKVYNMKYIKEILPFYFQHCYTYIPAALIQLKCLDLGYTGVMIPDRIVTHNSTSESSWNPQKACLCARTITDINFRVSNKRMLYSILVFPIKPVIRSHFSNNYNQRNPMFLSQVYHGIYKYSLSFMYKTIFIMLLLFDKSKPTYHFVNCVLSFKNIINRRKRT